MYASNNACGMTLESIPCDGTMEPHVGSKHIQARARQFKSNYEMEPWNHMWKVLNTQTRASPFRPNYEMEPWNHGTTCEKYKIPS